MGCIGKTNSYRWWDYVFEKKEEKKGLGWTEGHEEGLIWGQIKSKNFFFLSGGYFLLSTHIGLSRMPPPIHRAEFASENFFCPGPFLFYFYFITQLLKKKREMRFPFSSIKFFLARTALINHIHVCKCTYVLTHTYSKAQPN